MFYVKNVPPVERILRVVLGIVLMAVALFVFLQPRSASSVLLIVVLIGSALFVAATGFVGWCPACALVGRKLKARQHPQ